MQNASVIVILVHGTFAQGAEWTRRGRLVAALKALPGVLVDYCDWSGTNTLSGRAQGAQRVAEKVASTLELYPNARIVLIAHSHGGNVCLSAVDSLCSQAETSRLAAVVCLATPFVHVTVRDLGWPTTVFGALLNILGLLFVVATPWVAGRVIEWLTPTVEPVFNWLYQPWWLRPFGVLVIFAWLGVAFVGPVIALIAVAYAALSLREPIRAAIGRVLSGVRRTVPRWVLLLLLGVFFCGSMAAGVLLAVAIDRHFVTSGLGISSLPLSHGLTLVARSLALIGGLLLPFVAAMLGLALLAFLLGSDLDPAATARSLEVPGPRMAKLLLIRQASDEVQGALASAQFAAWVTSRLWRSISWAADGIARLGSRVRTLRGFVICLSLASAGFIAGVIGMGDPSDMAIGVGMISSLLYLILVASPEVAALIAVVVFFPLAAAMSLFMMPFAVDLVWLGPLLEATSESTPKGDWSINNLGFGSTLDSGLRHSVYENPACVETIVVWLSEHFVTNKNEPTTQQPSR